jgi:competence protein ComEC
MIGILLGSWIPGFGIVIGLLTVVSGGVAFYCTYRDRPSRYIPILLFVFLGYLSIQPWLSPRVPADHIKHFTGVQRWEILGQIANPPSQNKHRTRFDIQVASLRTENQTHAVTGVLRVTAVGDVPALNTGTKIRFKSRLRSITNFKNPGGFDYKRYMAFKGIYATAYVRAERISIVEPSSPPAVWQTVNRIRHNFADRVQKSGSPEVQGVLNALIIGDRSRISETTRQAFNRAGVAHLLAISGLHIGIVATVVFALANWLMCWIKPLLWRAWTRKAAALLALPPVIAYGVVAGLSPSTQRAVLMVSVFLLTFLVAKEQDSLNTLALAALAILIVDPPSLFSISFQLSFVTVFIIIYGFISIRKIDRLQKVQVNRSWLQRLTGRLVSFFLVSFFAIGGSMPLVAFYFNQISVVGLAANFLVVPLVGFITVPLGLAGLFLSPLSTTLAIWCLNAGAVVLAVALDIVRVFAELPFAAFKTVTPSVLEIVCYYTLGWTLLDFIRAHRNGRSGSQVTAATGGNSNNRSSVELLHHNYLNLNKIFNIKIWGGGRRLKAVKLTHIVALLTLLILAADVCYWLYQRFWHSDLRVTAVDVGDGSAALLEIPGGTTIMIDGGGFSDNATFDVGARIIAPFLWQNKIKTIDLLILSHPNSDHLNGLIYLADHFNVTALWANGQPRHTLGYKKLMEVCSRRGIFLPAYTHLAREHRFGDVQLDILYPPLDFMDLKESDKWRNSNNNSLVLKVSYGETSFLFPGDIMAAAEMELAGSADGRLASTVLIAPHHGSRSSSSLQFIEKVDPEVVVVSCGRNSRFKFPHPEVLQRYADGGAGIYRTDLNGAVRLSTNGQLIRIKSFNPDPDKP